MSAYVWGVWFLACLLSFLALELRALPKHRWWTTLSEQVWRLPTWLRAFIAGFLLLLSAHFLAKTPLFVVWG